MLRLAICELSHRQFSSIFSEKPSIFGLEFEFWAVLILVAESKDLKNYKDMGSHFQCFRSVRFIRQARMQKPSRKQHQVFNLLKLLGLQETLSKPSFATHSKMRGVGEERGEHAYFALNVNDPPSRGFEGAVRFESLSPLEVAQRAGNSELVEILLEAGAKRSAEGMGLGLRSMSSMWSRVMSGGSDVQVVNPARPSKSCLRKSSWDDDDEIRTVVL